MIQKYIIDCIGYSAQHFNILMEFMENGSNLLLTRNVQAVFVCAYSGRARATTTSTAQTDEPSGTIHHQQ